MQQIKELLHQNGISVSEVEFLVVDQTFKVNAVLPLLEQAAELEVHRVLAGGDITDWSRMIDTYVELCDVAAPFSIDIELEFMPYRAIPSLPIAVRLIQEANRANTGVLVDAIHLSRSGGSPMDVQNTPSGIIKSTQLCDAPHEIPPTLAAMAQEARSARLPLGCGSLPLHDLLSALPDRTPMSVEVPKPCGRDEVEWAQTLLDTSNRVLRAWKEI